MGEEGVVVAPVFIVVGPTFVPPPYSIPKFINNGVT